MSETTVAIPGLPGKWTQIAKPYCYEINACLCPACGKSGAGFPWRGWFSCHRCPCVALVSDGRAFLPIGDEMNVTV